MNGRNTGKGAEAALDHMNQAYARMGLALVRKREPMARRRRDGSVFQGEAGVPDYSGTIAAGGRSVAFECKSTTGEAWETRHLRQDQRGRLAASHRFGAVVFVVVVLGANTPRSSAWLVPWSGFEAGEALHGRRWDAAALDALGVRMRGWDWLAAWEGTR